ncbi:PEP-CTERM sorting domain-containing protein [Fluviibacter phosphoraccumulans]|uniref:PEP-CTERM sorting domain-containing protein n=1 Tax=Fluviibacter phosphoraccumulans TaxID=1751046 RepID=UPI0024E1A7FB|nr:PEP-CTERM sorting domain-containing protein [Fluviibacter phosphoraccumulans]
MNRRLDMARRALIRLSGSSSKRIARSKPLSVTQALVSGATANLSVVVCFTFGGMVSLDKTKGVMQMKKKILAGFAIGLFTIAGAPSAHATVIRNTFGLSGPHSTITFDEHVLPSQAMVTTEYSSQGVTFSPGGLFSVYGPFGSGAVANIDGQYLANFIPSGFGGSRFPIFMSFVTPQTEAAFAFIGASIATIQAFLGGSLIESDSFATSGSASDLNNFIGFQNITFDAINVYAYSPSCDPFGVGWVCPAFVDNIQLPTASPSSVPEPATMLLTGLGLAGLVGAHRRKRLGTDLEESSLGHRVET